LASSSKIKAETKAVIAQRDRVFQERAWKTISTYEWWFRQQYNLPPTDPRYLNATHDIILEDYWCHELSARRHRVAENGGDTDQLDEVLAKGESFEEQLERFIQSVPEYKPAVELRSFEAGKDEPVVEIIKPPRKRNSQNG
jgi:hypothetical protein